MAASLSSLLPRKYIVFAWRSRRQPSSARSHPRILQLSSRRLRRIPLTGRLHRQGLPRDCHLPRDRSCMPRPHPVRPSDPPRPQLLGRRRLRIRDSVTPPPPLRTRGGVASGEAAMGSVVRPPCRLDGGRFHPDTRRGRNQHHDGGHDWPTSRQRSDGVVLPTPLRDYGVGASPREGGAGNDGSGVWRSARPSPARQCRPPPRQCCDDDDDVRTPLHARDDSTAAPPSRSRAMADAGLVHTQGVADPCPTDTGAGTTTGRLSATTVSPYYFWGGRRLERALWPVAVARGGFMAAPPSRSRAVADGVLVHARPGKPIGPILWGRWWSKRALQALPPPSPRPLLPGEMAPVGDCYAWATHACGLPICRRNPPRPPCSADDAYAAEPPPGRIALSRPRGRRWGHCDSVGDGDGAMATAILILRRGIPTAIAYLEADGSISIAVYADGGMITTTPRERVVPEEEVAPVGGRSWGASQPRLGRPWTHWWMERCQTPCKWARGLH